VTIHRGRCSRLSGITSSPNQCGWARPRRAGPPSIARACRCLRRHCASWAVPHREGRRLGEVVALLPAGAVPAEVQRCGGPGPAGFGGKGPRRSTLRSCAPVGSRSGAPRSGAPAGPGGNPLPATPGDEGLSFASPQASSRGSRVWRPASSTAAVAGPGCGFFVACPVSGSCRVPTAASSSSSFSRPRAPLLSSSTASPQRASQTLGGHGAVRQSKRLSIRAAKLVAGRWRPMGLAPDQPRIESRPQISGERLVRPALPPGRGASQAEQQFGRLGGRQGAVDVAARCGSGFFEFAE